MVALMLLGACGRIGYVVGPEENSASERDASLDGSHARDAGDGGMNLDVRPSDAGMDAGFEATPDAGPDGMEAGAGSDAATDAASGCSGGTEAPSGAWYWQDFDDGPGSWFPLDLQGDAGWLDGNAEDWGGTSGEWVTRDTGDCDRTLSVHRTSGGERVRWGIALSNDTGRRIVGVILRYDVEVSWSYYQAVDSESGYYGMRTERLAWWDGASLLTYSPYVSNSGVDSTLNRRWLNDTEKDAAGLTARGVTQSVAGLDVPPGGTLELQVGLQSTLDGAQEDLNIGIDNLEIEPVHP